LSVCESLALNLYKIDKLGALLGIEVNRIC
jgi:hypothetical protein